MWYRDYMAKRKMTIEELAALTQKEFLNTNKRSEGVDKRLEKLETILQTTVDILDLMRSDIHDIKITLNGSTRSATALEETVRHLDRRVTRLEGKTGLHK